MAERDPFVSFLFLAFLFFFFFLVYDPVLALGGRNHGGGGCGLGAADPRLQTYIVHVEQPEGAAFTDLEERDAWYRSFLPVDAAADGGLREPRWVHSYYEVLSGFAARLTEEEVAVMEKEGFLRAFPDTVVPLATTHTPEFLGLHQGSGLWGTGAGGGRLGEGVIVGMLDSGITPGHPSFGDDDMPLPPSRWKGSCQPPEFCNKKIIGARNFVTDNDPEKASPADEDGHGTHTASTVAGSFVRGASVLGSAKGTASGIAPRAHLAIYKVCGIDRCKSSDILAGMDAAVADGVDVLSLSLGGDSMPFYSDMIAIGAFGANKRGVFVSCAAGNSGPEMETVSNDAPWILTVAASTMDRSIVATVNLGDGSKFEGQSAFQPSGFTHESLPLVFPGSVEEPSAPIYCGQGSLVGFDVKGKVVVCQRGGYVANVAKGAAVLGAGGASMIIVNRELEANTTEATAHVLPASHVSFAAGTKIINYINASSHPTASISFEGTKLGLSSYLPAPAVASFSSRGPSVSSPGILKPDVLGPGDNVLAAWPFPVGPPSKNTGSKGASFNVISGTSMAAPHLSGVAALLKSAHPDWSPAAIKSAIMTTADVRGNDGELIKDENSEPASLFDIGAGHVNASRAADPGLVYDLGTSDYVAYICSLGYTDEQVAAVVGQRGACAAVKSISGGELNYPSISVTLRSMSPKVAVNRTVTNVGEAGETYKVEVEEPAGVAVSVNPQTLKFSEVKEKQSFTVSFTKRGRAHGSLQGNLRWVSAKHAVRSSISITVE
ncbi:hypothetical protein Taro_020686 [Colocasia esculenta]|uniref:Subtilisin-like protease SBT1.2 n=1 Tax=Colocasia esculenta TaxID=4460 RepID=A0A843UWY8_COLES|nr:hypothetical protein [Colocasia esculenta]